MALPPFQAFLDAHRADVYRFLVAAVGPEEADDCFQETFMSALRSYSRLRPNSNLRAWVLTIAHRKALDHFRAKGRRAVPVEEIPEQVAPPAPDGEPELWRAVRKLPPKQRAALLHRYVNDLAYADVAAVIGCSEDAARQNVRAGLASLREEWVL